MNRLKLYLVLVVAFFFSAAYLANKNHEHKPKRAQFVNMYLPIWAEAEAQVLEIAEAMPEGKFNYKPTEESKTFAEQIVHIANSSYVLSQFMLQGKKVDMTEPDASKMSKKEILAFSKEKMDATAGVISGLNEEQLKEMVKTFAGNEMPKQQAVIWLHDHVTNHKAKANLYVRMNDINPPAYRYY
jgi:uncharacterized damage-inducible protein DinB